MTDHININGLTSYNEGAIPAVVVGGTQYAYLTSDAKTHMIDLSDFTGEDLYSIAAGDIEHSLLRTGSPPAPDEFGTPYVALGPPGPVDLSSWRNSYTGILGAAVQVNGSNEIVHTIFHAEDKSQDGSNLNSTWINHPCYNDPECDGPPWAYTRIGYARSDTNSAIDLTVTGYVGNEVILECLQPEHVLKGYRGIVGNGGFSMIEDETYYYCFFSRTLDHSGDYKNGWSMPSVITFQGTGDYICVARATKTSVQDTSYDINGNPWGKYYDGSWGESGYRGLSTPIINEQWRANPSILFSEELNEYVIVCAGTDGFYLYTQNSSSLADWDNGMLFITRPDNHLIHYPVLVGSEGESTYSPDGNHRLYFAYDEDTTLGGHELARRIFVLTQ